MTTTGQGAINLELRKERVSFLRNKWQGCMQCGKLKQKVYYRSPDGRREAICCSEECALKFHSKPWGVAVKCIIANQIIHGSPEPVISATDPTPETDTNNSALIGESLSEQEVMTRYKTVFDSVDELKKNLEALLDEMKKEITISNVTTGVDSLPPKPKGESSSTKPPIQQPEESVSKVEEWATRFNNMLEDLNEVSSPSFREQLFNQVATLLEIYELYKDVSEDAEQDIKQNESQVTNKRWIEFLRDVKKLLKSLVKEIPYHKLVSNNRLFIDQLVDKHEWPVPRLVLTFDGGGLRGLLTVQVAKALLKELRQLSNNQKANLGDFFDFAVGTSTGALLLSSITLANKSLEEVEELYKQMGKVVFVEESKVDFMVPTIAKYLDQPVLNHLIEQVGMDRLDDAKHSFNPSLDHANRKISEVGKEESTQKQIGQGIRVGFTAVDISSDPNQLVLFRNYDSYFTRLPPPETAQAALELENMDLNKRTSGSIEWLVQGTNRVYIWEALRSSSSAPMYFHPYSRFYAPLTKDTQSLAIGARTGYLEKQVRTFTGRRKSVLHTHMQLISEREPQARWINDTYMNSKPVLVDGGMGANNPSVVALVESRRIWPQDRVAALVSFGTGRVPQHRSDKWNDKIKTPATNFFKRGDQSLLTLVGSLLNSSVAGAAAETENTEFLIRKVGGDFLESYHRLNPIMEEYIALDDYSPANVQKLIHYGQRWASSEEGRAQIEACAKEIMRIHVEREALMKAKKRDN